MSKKRVYGPKAFLVTLGLILAFLGVLVLLAVPAAIQMDKKAALDGEEPSAVSRAATVKRSAAISLGTGGGLMLLGFALGWRKARQSRSH